MLRSAGIPGVGQDFNQKAENRRSIFIILISTLIILKTHYRQEMARRMDRKLPMYFSILIHQNQE